MRGRSGRVEPRRVRPRLPEKWHVPNIPRLYITWTHAREKLVGEKVYWVATASRQGRPHSAPVWGIWEGNRFYFETDPKSAKGRNLSNNPKIVLHLQDGMDTVIVEGTAHRERMAHILRLLRKNYARKYQYTPDWSNSKDQIVFRVDPRIVHAWKAPRMHRSLVKFIFQAMAVTMTNQPRVRFSAIVLPASSQTSMHRSKSNELQESIHN